MRSLIILLLLVIFFRFFQLQTTPAGLYWDELDTGYQAYSLLKTGRDYFGHPFPAHLQSLADFRSSLYMYLTVPTVGLLGLTPFAVRLPAAISSILILPLMYWLGRRFLSLPPILAGIPAVVLGLSPWVLVQGRIAAESQLLTLYLALGLIFFLKFTKTGRGLNFSALFFALTLWTYGTAKLFVPLFLLGLTFAYQDKLKSVLNFRRLLVPAIIFLTIVSPLLLETFTKNISMRFSELSVFTDPMTASQVDYRRLESALGRGTNRTLGMQPALIEKITSNKITLWGERVLNNYLSAFSTDFLFISGDPQLRHHLGLANTGQFYALEQAALLVGLAVLLFSSRLNRRVKKLLLIWLLVAPLPAVITRDGGNHAPRLLPLLLPLVFLISLGVHRILQRRILAWGYLLVYTVSVLLTGFYLFSTYRTVSASHFNAGFIPAVEYALSHKDEYSRVILDGHNESLLMAYLFTSSFDPKTFQNSFPLPSATILPGIDGYKFAQIHILYPGTRDWNQISLDKSTLVITSTTQPNSGTLSALQIFENPDGSPALVAISK